jgi:hypothetical protein
MTAALPCPLVQLGVDFEELTVQYRALWLEKQGRRAA